MNYIVLNKETEEKVKEIKRRVHRLQNWGSIASLRNLGVDTQRQVGASYVSLKTLAESYTPNETLAVALWQTRQREEQILACFLFPKEINKEKITQLMQDCSTPEIAEYMGSIYISEHPDIKGIIESWANSSEPFLQIAALSAGARHLVLYKTASLISQDLFKTLTSKEYTNNYVRLIAARHL